jgi:AcrR family transcriptional regulator
MNARSSVARGTRTRRRGRPPVGSHGQRTAARTALLEAAEDVAAARGIDATTIAAIADRAGVAVGTLYNYFSDRDQLLASLFKMRREQLLPRVQAAAREAQRLPFERRLRAFLAAALGIYEEHRKFLQVAVSADQHALKVHDRKRTAMAAVVEALTDILLAVAPAQAEAHAQMIVGAMKALVLWRLERGEPFTDDADLLADTFLSGIAR